MPKVTAAAQRRRALANLLRLVGPDRALAYNFASKAISAILQPVSLFCIAAYLSSAEQGYYYTFYSILSANILLELGLGVVITHFAANEFGHLAWSAGNKIEGDPKAVERLLSLARQSFLWYSVISATAMAALIPLGLIFLRSGSPSGEVVFTAPWVLLILGSGFALMTVPIVALLNGCGKIAQLQALRIVQNLAGALGLIGGLLMGAKLYAPAISQVLQVGCLLFWFAWTFRAFVGQCVAHRRQGRPEAISWRREVLPMQSRVAANWLAAYSSNHILTPVLFALRGSGEAGLLGMTRSLAEIPWNAGLPWLTTRSPRYGALATQKRYEELDKLARKSTLQTLLISSAVTVAIVVAVMISGDHGISTERRILSVWALSALCLANIAGLLNVSLAEYVRAHKVEPFVKMNLVQAGVIAILCVPVGKAAGAEGIAFLFASAVILSVPVSVVIFRGTIRVLHGADRHQP